MDIGTSQNRPFFKGRFGWAFAVLLALCATNPGVAEAAPRIDLTDGFGADRVPVSGSLRFEKWENMLARHRAQAQEARACEETWFSRCPIADWQEMLDDLQDADFPTQLTTVNAWFNRNFYVSDRRNWRVSDYWATPLELMERGGDCEDYAIAKYLSLRRLGVRGNAMRVVVLKDTSRRQVHAVLVVDDGDRHIVLDNLYSRPVVSSEIGHYVPVYSLSEAGVWRHYRTKDLSEMSMTTQPAG